MKFTKPILIALLCISLAPIIMTMQNMQRLQPAARQAVRRGGAQAQQALRIPKNIAPSSWHVVKPAAQPPIAAAPKINYGNYQDYGNLAGGQQQHQQYQKPFDIRPFAGISLAATLAALQQKRAESLVNEYAFYEYVNKTGARKKVIFLGDAHLEDDPVLGPYINKYRLSHATQSLNFLADLKKTPNPVTFFIEQREWEIPEDKKFFQALQRSRKPYKMGAMSPAIIEAVLSNMQYANITYIPFDKRSKSVTKTLKALDRNKQNTSPKEFAQLTGGLTFEQRDAWLRDNLAKDAKTQLDKAQKIIDKAGLPPEMGEELVAFNQLLALRAHMVAAQPFDYATYKNAYFYCDSLETDTALACDLYDALERDGDETIVIQAGRTHLETPAIIMAHLVGRPAERVHEDAQDELGLFIGFMSQMTRDPVKKAELIKIIPEMVGQEYLNQQKAVLPDEILGAYILYHVQQNTVTDFRTPILEFLKK